MSDALSSSSVPSAGSSSSRERLDALILEAERDLLRLRAAREAVEDLAPSVEAYDARTEEQEKEHRAARQDEYREALRSLGPALLEQAREQDHWHFIGKQFYPLWLRPLRPEAFVRLDGRRFTGHSSGMGRGPQIRYGEYGRYMLLFGSDGAFYEVELPEPPLSREQKRARRSWQKAGIETTIWNEQYVSYDWALRHARVRPEGEFEWEGWELSEMVENKGAELRQGRERAEAEQHRLEQAAQARSLTL